MNGIPLFQIEDAVPTELGKLAYAGHELYEDSRLGVRLRYERGITKADVYLYDLGLQSIPSDIRSDSVMEFFQQSCAEILSLADRGMYLDIETRASQYLHLPDHAPDPMYLWAAFYYRQTPHPFVANEGFRFSHILLRTDGGFINKVRYTYPENAIATSSEDMVSFLLDWHDAIPRD